MCAVVQTCEQCRLFRSSNCLISVLQSKKMKIETPRSSVLAPRLGPDKSSILRLSGPLKQHYAEENGLDSERLLDASEYKENYRVKMIEWGEEKRRKDYGYFCRIITAGPGSEKPLWIISDARRRTDLQYFSEQYPEKMLTVRVAADSAIRQQRGWIYTPGVDDAASECDLDNGVSFDVVFDNSGTDNDFERQMRDLINTIDSRILST